MSVKQVFNTSAEIDYPSILPTLNLDFANSKTLDPRITFERASGGTYVGADGLIKYAGVNEPRFDHDPETGESLGLLIEESRTNLSLNSQDFTDNVNNTAWRTASSRATLIANTGIDDPSGGTTASRWASGTTDSEELIYHVLPAELSQGVAYTASCWIRRVSGTGEVKFAIGDNSDNFVTSQLDSVPYGTWVRCHDTRIITGDPAVDFTGSAYIFVYPDGSDPTTIDIWGYQMEEGAFPTSYIPTEGSTRTRSADNAYIKGSNFLSWYNQTEGSIFCRYKNSSLDTSDIRIVWGLESINDPDSSLRSPQSGSNRIRLQFGNIFSPSGSNLFLISTEYRNSIVAYNQFENLLLMDGKPDFVSASPHTNRNNLYAISIGARTIGGDSALCGHISRLTYYPKRLPNEQLQALTE